MPLSTAAVGKSYEPVTYAVGREKVKEYALAVGEQRPAAPRRRRRPRGRLRRRRRAAHVRGRLRRAGAGPGIFDPEVGIDFALHGPRRPGVPLGSARRRGDEVTTRVTVKSIEQKGAMGFYVFESVSTNQAGHTVCVGTWTNIVRGV